MAQSHKYGVASLAKLETCHDEIRRVMRRALAMTPAAIDITIVWGFRNKGQQNGLDPSVTNARWPQSYHNAVGSGGQAVSDAVDFAPWITLPSGRKGIPWRDENLFCLLAGIVLAAAFLEGVELTWGADFDRDGSTQDQTLADLGHVQRTNASPRPAAEAD